ncbi:glycoside hydrolase family 127 protein [Pseudonocardia sp. CA-107938]|uniref:glycoside hydrolase family 127 protein n=1 Tax=Pseudonocardia sp. CA-107938 TaxID=3240021 RepID=UPI003D908136
MDLHPTPTAAPVVPSRGRLRPLTLGEVTVTGGPLLRRQQVNGTATLPHIEHWLEREGWIANFDLAAAGQLPAGRRGREFSDSEVYKYLEALAWEIGRTGDADLERRFHAVVARVAAAQEPDGYLNTEFGRPGQQPRWSDLPSGHELYCIGHLLQAAVARLRTRPDATDGLVEIARRAADLVCTVFGPDGLDAVCGHPEIEPALVEFGRATGDERDVAQAALFVARRGHGVLPDGWLGRTYYQDDVPVRSAQVLRGHAVRAGYLAAGAVDVAVEQGDDELLAALVAQWDTTVARRTYLTGGQGSHHEGEAFGDDWVLPPDRAYAETCAGIGSIMFSWRLLLARGGARYADLIERTLYNIVATSTSADGTRFFYANTLHQRRPGAPVPDDRVSPRASSTQRAPWFAVSCCPPNVARTLASLGTFLATVDDDGLQLHQYAPSTIATSLPDGTPVTVEIDTEYPRSGLVSVRIGADADRPWTLTLRVPAWAEGARVVVRSSEVTEQPAAPGTVAVRRTFRAGDVVELHLPVAPRFTAADPRIDATRGCLAVERGPEVLCLESVDLAAATAGALTDVADVRLDPSVPPEESGGDVVVRLRAARTSDRDWPYGAGVRAVADGEAIPVRLVPYHDWAERGPSTMRVWIPVTLG